MEGQVDEFCRPARFGANGALFPANFCSDSAQGAEEGTEGKRQGSATLPVGAGRSADGWKVQSGVELGVLTSREGRAGDTLSAPVWLRPKTMLVMVILAAAGATLVGFPLAMQQDEQRDV